MDRLSRMGLLAAISFALSACGTVKEKTAPCKRPASLAAFARVSLPDCGPMQAVNDPATAFASIGIRQETEVQINE